MNFESTMSVSIADHVLFQEIGDERALLNLNTERYFVLDDVGSGMWDAVVGSASIEQAYESLLARYDVDPDQLRRDLHDLIRQLVEHDLVHVSGK